MAFIYYEREFKTPLGNYIGPEIYKNYRTNIEAAEDIGIKTYRLSMLLNQKEPQVSDEIIGKVCKKLNLSKEKAISLIPKKA